MVCEHLPMVLTSVLDVDDVNLLQPESELSQIVPLHRGCHVAGWKVGPELAEIKPVFRVIPKVLSSSLASVVPLWS